MILEWEYEPQLGNLRWMSSQDRDLPPVGSRCRGAEARAHVTAIDISSWFGLGAFTLLTLNILLGLLLSTKYNPVRRWPHRRVDTVTLHNWTGYLALALLQTKQCTMRTPGVAVDSGSFVVRKNNVANYDAARRAKTQALKQEFADNLLSCR